MDFLLKVFEVLQVVFSYISLISGIIFQYLAIIFSVYLIVLSIPGIFKKKSEDPNKTPINTRFAVLIAAHNESRVIENCVKALKSADYPTDLIDIYLIADNCTDDTAKIGRESGASVFERFNEKEKGKSFALAWMLEELWALNIDYDAVAFFDADNIVDKDYFKEMNKFLNKGHQLVQGYLGCKNPEDTWISGCYSISYWVTNRIFQLSRYQIGLCSSLGGTGFVVKTPLLKEIGWNSNCLTEDLEFQMKIVAKGLRVSWNHDAVFYDEKPLTLKQSIKQRTRWMQGHADCAGRFFWGLLRQGIRDRKLIKIDSAIYLIQPFMFCILLAISIVSILSQVVMSFFDISHLYYLITLVVMMEAISLFYLVLLLMEKKFFPKVILYLAIFPMFMYTWIVPIFLGWKRRHEHEWNHTEHTRSIELNDNLK